MLRVLVIISLLAPYILLGQQEYVFTTANGLPSNTVYDVVQDSKGFIWVATSKGVVKYNGKTFKTFTVQDGLPNNDTWKLETTPDGKVWYFSKSNQQGYIKNDSVYSFPIVNNETVSPGSFIIQNDKVGFSKGEIYYLKQDQWQPLFGTNNFNLVDDNGYAVLYSDTLIIDRDVSKIELFKKQGSNLEKTFEVSVPFQLMTDGSANSHFGLYNTTFWQLYSKGLVLLNFKQHHFNTIPLKSIRRDSLMFIWANTNNIQWKSKEAVRVFDYSFQEIKTVSHPALEKSTRAIVDRDGNLWLCSLSQGLKMIPATTLNNHLFFKNQKVQKVQTLSDSLFAGIYDEALQYYNQGIFTPTTLQPKGNIYQIKKLTGYGKYAFGGANSDSDNNTIKREQLENFTADYSYFGFKDIIIHQDTEYMLFHYLVAKKNNDNMFEILQYTDGKNGFAIHQDSLLLYGSDGLHYIKNDTIVKYPNQNTKKTISYLSTLNDKKKLFLGTDGFGLQVLKNGQFTPIEQTSGLSVNRIIKKDSLIWLATQKGVQVLKLDVDIRYSKIIDSYYLADGLLDQNVNDIELKDSLLFVATDLGLSTLNIKSSIYRQKPQLYFNTPSDHMQFSYKEANNISISFGTLGYTNQENFKYQYRLLPEQKKWQTTNSQEIIFSQLVPGNHTLEVSVIDQHQNKTTKQLFIKVKPDWWQTKNFKIIIVFGSVLLLFGLGWLMYRIVKKKTQEKAEREKKLAGLELQALRSQMNPHFVHNSLNAIQYYIQRNEVSLSEKYLSKFSKLIRQFFDFSRKQTISIAEEIDLLTNYLEIEKLRFEDKLNYNIKVDKQIAVNEVYIPTMILQPIVENSINHGIFHKEGKGNITIQFKREASKNIKIIIEDDGIGIEKAKEIYKTSDRNYRSNSTEVLKERLELLQHNKNWKINFNIKDLRQLTGNSGTRVIINLSTIHET